MLQAAGGVPVFANESNATRLGSTITRQILREFQREGTFCIAGVEDAAIEVQGTVVKADSDIAAYDITASHRNREYRFRAECKVSLIDRHASPARVVVNNRVYHAETTYNATNDQITGERDAMGRLAEDFARQIVDDVLNRKW